ncbi:16S rRNA (cytosine(1402)-N(4))-methyltransferase RsmH [Candidatus Uhrbacteria bacterium]|nr:16S rRNA (cytosine(1402)-N(4))-methyltransferase RsmH [Candidatus Uhrbacteria bacterium]
MFTHKSVLLQEVLDHLQPEPNQSFIDGTVGQGGHSRAILMRALSVVPSNKTRLLAIDRDAENLSVARKQLSEFGDSVVFVHDSYANVKANAYAHQFTHVNGILLDLGFASSHVDDPRRGFSFRAEGPLDMRYDTSKGMTAADIVDTWSEDELARIFRQYGEEKQASRVAQAIIAERTQHRFLKTTELAACVSRVLRSSGKIHPATRVFQALRIAVNDELGELRRALPDFVDLLLPGGRLLIITFHSLEDRIVKQFMKENSQLRVVTKHAIKPSKDEIQSNPRARSAKLRVAEKIDI